MNECDPPSQAEANRGEPASTPLTPVAFQPSMPVVDSSFLGLVDRAPFALLVAQDGLLTFVNGTARQLLGSHPPEALLGRPLLSLFPAGEQTRLAAILQSPPPGIDVLRNWETALCRQDGTTLDVEVTITNAHWEGRPAFHVMALEITGRREAEVALSESEERFRNILGNSQAAYFRIDQAARLLVVNDAWLRLHDFHHPQEVVGKPLEQFLPQEEHARLREVLNLAQAGVPIPAAEGSRRRRDGSLGRHLASLWPVRLHGQPGGLEGFLIDTTELHRARADFHLLFSRMIDGFAVHEMIFDEHGRPVDYRFLEVNPAFEKLTGLRSEVVIGRTVREVLPGEDPFWIETFGKVVSTGEPALFQHASTQLHQVFEVSAFRNAPGQFACVFVDVTEHRRAAEALQRSEAELLAIYEQAPGMMILLDAHLRAHRVNRATVEFVGRAESELVGLRPGELLACAFEGDHPRGCGESEACEHCPLRAHLLETLRTGTPVHRREIQIRRLLNHKIEETSLLISLARVQVSDQPVVLLCLEDITAHRAMEAKFLRSQRLESIGLLASGVAHDLNNVLSPVLMSLNILRLQLRQPEDNALLDMLEAGVKRGAAIIKQLLLFGRGLEGNRTRLKPGDAIKDIAQIVRETFPKSIQLDLAVEKGLPGIVADPTQIHQVLLNLCVNARDAMPQGGTLTLGARQVQVDETLARLFKEVRPGSHVLLEVRDTGEGIPRELLDRIFDPFFTTKKPGHGTGLGLATVQGIARGHGGFVDVESVRERGTTFRVYLPTTEIASTTPEGERPAAIKPRGRKELVLVIDDEQSIRGVISRVLQINGYRVITAQDGLEGIQQIDRHAAEVRAVIVDMLMPKLDGAGVIRHLRQQAPPPLLIAISGMMQMEQEAKLATQGPIAFLPKPFPMDQLLSVLDAGLHTDDSSVASPPESVGRSS